MKPENIKPILKDLRSRIPTFFSKISPASLFSRYFERFPPTSSRLRSPGALISIGKAAGGMTGALSKTFNIAPAFTLSILPKGYPTPPKGYPCLFGSHPLPDRDSLSNMHSIRTFIETLPPTLGVAVAISGGSSSLIADPVDPVTIEEKAWLTRQLLESGAPIEVINAMRIHLSKIKGGGLAALLGPRSSETFILSDIPGRESGLVGSSLMFPVPRDGARMLEILSLWMNGKTLPPSIQEALSQHSLPDFSQAGNSHSDPFERTIASSDTLLTVAQETLLSSPCLSGLPLHILTGELRGEAQEAAHVLSSLILWSARHTPGPSVFLCSGETTVDLKNILMIGRGGRTLELGLALTLALSSIPAIVLSLASDGWDGNSGLSGMIGISRSAQDPRFLMEGRHALFRHDTASFLEDHRMAIRTGPSGTNLNDLLMVTVLE